MDRSLMNDATSSDDSPVSGYQLNEIAKATNHSYQVNQQIQQYLLIRLEKPHHNTKFKCLVIIKHVCRTGRPEFKREMGRNVGPIKDCLQYRGPPDPLRGDEIYRRVRDCAREVLEALFDGQMPVTTSAVVQGFGNNYEPTDKPRPSNFGMASKFASNLKNNIMGDGTDAKYTGHPGASGALSGPGYNGGGGGGYGGPDGPSGGYPGGGGYGGYSGGMGNPNYQDARSEKTWLETAADIASTVASTAVTGASAAADYMKGEDTRRGSYPSTSSSHFNNGSSGHGGYNYATNRGNNAIHAHSNPYNPYPSGGGGSGFSSSGGVGGTQQHNGFGGGGAGAGYGHQNGMNPAPAGWQNPTSSNNQMVGNSSDSINFTQPSDTGVVPNMPPPVPGVGRAGGGVSDGRYELGLIESMCEPGGLRPVPPEDKLLDFLTSASTLSADVVGNCLLDVLNSESWQSRTKGLIVLARLVKQPDCQAHMDWWFQRVDEIEALQSDGKANVRTQAFKTIRAIDPSRNQAVQVQQSANAAGGRRSSRPGTTTAAAAAAAAAVAEDIGGVEGEGGTVAEQTPDAEEEPGTAAESEPNLMPELEVEQPPEPEPEPEPVVMNLLEMDDYADPATTNNVAEASSVAAAPAAPVRTAVAEGDSAVPVPVTVTATTPVSTTSEGIKVEENQGDEDAAALFAGMSVGGAGAPIPPSSNIPNPVVAPVPTSASTTEVPDFFDSMTLVSDVPAPSTSDVAPSNAVAPAAATVENPIDTMVMIPVKPNYQDDFAGLMDAGVGQPVAPVTAPIATSAHASSSLGIAPSGGAPTGTASDPVPPGMGNVGQGPAALPVVQTPNYSNAFSSFLPQEFAQKGPTGTTAQDQLTQQQQQQLQFMQLQQKQQQQQYKMYMQQQQQMYLQQQQQGMNVPQMQSQQMAGVAPFLTRPAPGVPMAGNMMPTAAAAAAAAPPAGMMMRGPPPAGGVTPYGAMPMMSSQGMIGYQQQPSVVVQSQETSVIAPSMLAHTVERKNVPALEDGAGASGFNFMASGAASTAATGGGSSSGGDSFSFVSDAMKAQK